MDRGWKAIERGIEVVRQQRMMLIALVGLGLCRSCLGWTLGVGRSSFLGGSIALEPHLLTDAGEFIGFISLAILSNSKGPLAKQSAPLFAAGALFLFGAFLVFLYPIADATFPAMIWIGSFLAGLGYAALFLLWLELCGCLEPRTTVFIVAGSYLVSLCAWIIINAAAPSFGFVAVLVLFAISALSLIVAYENVRTVDLPRTEAKKSIVSWRILTWVALMSLAFGFGDGFTNMGFSTLASKVGMVVPIAIIVFGMRLLPNTFDMGVIYRITLPLMMCGITCTVLVDAWPIASQTMMSAAQSSYQLLACAIVCMASFRNKTSAVFSCGLLLGISTLCAQLGKLLGAQAGIWGSNSLVSFLVVLALIVAGSLLLKEQDFSSLITSPESQTDQEKRLHVLAGEYALSKREETVFVMMALGAGTQEIGDELFIAQSTVRAHASRIYEKFSVHNRQEFDALLRAQLETAQPLA